MGIKKRPADFADRFFILVDDIAESVVLGT